MKTSHTPLLNVLKAPDSQYVIPVYQRTYSWTEHHCEALWEDAVRAGKNERSHFFGTVLYKPEGMKHGFERLALVDGQQRLATLMLLLVSLRDYLQAENPRAAAIISQQLLLFETNEGEAPKIILSRTDKDTLNALVLKTDLPKEEKISILILENLEYFRSKMRSSSFDAEMLMRGLEQFTVVAVELEALDKPQLVFESLNAKGMPLKTSDLIRNLLFTRLGYEEQIRLFEHYWEPLELLFDEIEERVIAESKTKIGIPPKERLADRKGMGLDAALHAWLVRNAPRIAPHARTDLYSAFKTYIAERPDLPLDRLLESINASCVDFAARYDSDEVRRHLDWVTGKPEGFGGRK